MVDRIKKLISKQNLTATQFAGEIGVQRSAVSHLLSGRNKPSLDFMLKIKNSFPEVNLDWLLLGTGKMMLPTQEDQKKNENRPADLFQEEVNLKVEEPVLTGGEVEESETPLNIAKSEDNPVYKSLASEMEQTPQKVILLFPDHTFKVFNAG